MSKVSNDIPVPIKPYITLGLDLNYKPHLSSITTDCPFCGKEGKWNILVENGLWRCVYCNIGSENGKVSKGGNIITFQRLLWEKGKGSTQQHDYTELSQHRSIEEDTLITWGLIKNPFNDEWLIPSFSTDGKLNTFYRYVEFRNKWQVVALPNSNHQLFGVNLFDNKKNNVVFCEGPWDAMSLWETLRHCKYKEQSNNKEMIYTDEEDLSLLSTYNIIGIPGVLVFREGWDKLIINKKVIFCFDNDHPKMVNEKLRPGAAYEGLRKVIDTLMKKEDRPKSASYLQWGDWLNYDPNIKSGYDVRDFLTDTEETNIRLLKLLEMIKPVPRGWCDGSVPYIPKKPAQPTQSTSQPTPTNVSTPKIKMPPMPKLLIDISRLSSNKNGNGTGTNKESISLPRFPVPGFLKGQKNSPLAFMTRLRAGLSNTNGYHVSNGSNGNGAGHDLINGVKDSENPENIDPDVPSSQEDSDGEDDGDMSTSLECLPCTSWKDLIPSWHKALKWTDELDIALSVMLSSIASTPMVGDQLWCKIVSAPSSGKSVLCEALSIAKKYCIAKSTIRGFHSGYKVDKTGSIDTSLIAKLKNKTLIIKDGDTLLRAPNLDQILSEARDIYDRISRTDFRNNMCRSYEGLSMTWILCGTASLHALDSSELGERFLDCVIVDKMAVELEREIAYAKALQAAKEIQLVVEGNMKTLDGPEMLKAKQLTGGYVEYLRMNCPELIRSVNIDPHTLKRCSDLAEFVSFIRTKPSKTQEETVQRELCFRLTSQLTRLSGFLAVVMNKTDRDTEVMKRTEKVAMDTCRGRNLQVAKFLFHGSRLHGTSLSHLADLTQETDARLRTHLRFLNRLDVVETFQYSSPASSSTRPRYRLTSRFHELYRKIFGSK